MRQQRVRFEERGGVRLLVVDYSEMQRPDEILAFMAHVQGIIEAQPLRSIRYVANVTNLHFNFAVVQAFKAYGARCRPYFVASAVVGLGGLQLAIHRTMTRLMGQDIRAFASESEALDWLAALPA